MRPLCSGVPSQLRGDDDMSFLRQAQEHNNYVLGTSARPAVGSAELGTFDQTLQDIGSRKQTGFCSHH